MGSHHEWIWTYTSHLCFLTYFFVLLLLPQIERVIIICPSANTWKQQQQQQYISFPLDTHNDFQRPSTKSDWLTSMCWHASFIRFHLLKCSSYQNIYKRFISITKWDWIILILRKFGCMRKNNLNSLNTNICKIIYTTCNCTYNISLLDRTQIPHAIIQTIFIQSQT